jgi:hypothetical protein
MGGRSGSVARQRGAQVGGLAGSAPWTAQDWHVPCPRPTRLSAGWSNQVILVVRNMVSALWTGADEGTCHRRLRGPLNGQAAGRGAAGASAGNPPAWRGPGDPRPGQALRERDHCVTIRPPTCKPSGPTGRALSSIHGRDRSPARAPLQRFGGLGRPDVVLLGGRGTDRTHAPEPARPQKTKRQAGD